MLQYVDSISCINEYLAIAIYRGGNVRDLVCARNCSIARMLHGEAELVSLNEQFCQGGQQV